MNIDLRNKPVTITRDAGDRWVGMGLALCCAPGPHLTIGSQGIPIANEGDRVDIQIGDDTACISGVVIRSSDTHLTIRDGEWTTPDLESTTTDYNGRCATGPTMPQDRSESWGVQVPPPTHSLVG